MPLSLLNYTRLRLQTPTKGNLMIKNFDFELKDINGDVCKDEKGNNVTAKNIILNSLERLDLEESSLSGADKASKYRLMILINSGGDVELKSEDVTLFKKLIGKFWGPLVVGRMYEYLDT